MAALQGTLGILQVCTNTLTHIYTHLANTAHVKCLCLQMQGFTSEAPFVFMPVAVCVGLRDELQWSGEVCIPLCICIPKQALDLRSCRVLPVSK